LEGGHLKSTGGRIREGIRKRWANQPLQEKPKHPQTNHRGGFEAAKGGRRSKKRAGFMGKHLEKSSAQKKKTTIECSRKDYKRARHELEAKHGGGASWGGGLGLVGGGFVCTEQKQV